MSFPKQQSPYDDNDDERSGPWDCGAVHVDPSVLKGVERRRRMLVLAERKAPAVVLLLAVIAFACFAVLPVPSNKIHQRVSTDENALLADHVDALYSASDDAAVVPRLLPAANSLADVSQNKTSRERAIWARDQFSAALPSHSYLHSYKCEKNQDNDGFCHNAFAVIRGRRADPGDAILLSTSWYNERLGTANPTAVPLLIALARAWAEHKHWSRSIILVASETVQGAEQFAKDYKSKSDINRFFGGHVIAAIHFELPQRRVASVILDAVGQRGTLPNLDLISTAVYIFARKNINVLSTWTNYTPLRALVSAANSLYIPSGSTYLYNLKNLYSVLISQALEQSRGPQAGFKSYGCDALSIFGVPILNSDDNSVSSFGAVTTLTLGQALEMIVTSLSNLNEYLHHATANYILLSPFEAIRLPIYFNGPLIFAISVLFCALYAHKYSNSTVAIMYSCCSFWIGVFSYTLPCSYLRRTFSVVTSIALILVGAKRIDQKQLFAALGHAGYLLAPSLIALGLFNFGLSVFATLIICPVYIFTLLFTVNQRKVKHTSFRNSLQLYILRIFVLLMHPVFVQTALLKALFVPAKRTGVVAPQATVILWALYFPIHILVALNLFTAKKSIAKKKKTD